MTFLSSLFLWALPLTSVPVLIHLLSRRRKDVIRWSAMQFLLASAIRRRRIWRLSDWVFMVLRALAIAAFVLALAQPMVPAHWFGLSGPRDVILILDDSLSTDRVRSSSASGPEQSRIFDELLRQADHVIDTLGDDDLLRAMSASGAPRWLMPSPQLMTAHAKSELQARLEKCQPTLASTDVLAAVREAVDTETDRPAAARLIIVLSDGQSYRWRVESPDAWQQIREKLHDSPSSGIINVVVTPSPGEAFRNISVESISAQRTVAAVATPLTLKAIVKNTGQVPTSPTTATWSLGEKPIGVTPLPALTPGESASLSIEHALEATGMFEVCCQVNIMDSLAMDNSAQLVVEAVDAVPILVVDGTERTDSFHTDVGYLLIALGADDDALESGWRSVFRPKVIGTSDLAVESLDTYPCVVLANVGPLSSDIVSRLEDYARKGGGVWIVLGDQTDTGEFNRLMHNNAKGFSPLALTDSLSLKVDRDHFDIIEPSPVDHPATRLLVNLQRLDLDRVKIYRRHRFTPQPEGSKVSVLLAASEGDPLVIENVLDRGRVIVQAIPMNVSWSNLPACQAFVVMIHEWLWYLSEQGLPRWNLALGERLATKFPASDVSNTSLITTPQDESIEITGYVRNDHMIFGYGPVVIPGPYELTVNTSQGQVHQRIFCVNRDAEESDLSPLGESDRQLLVSSAGLRFVDDPLMVDDERAAEMPVTAICSSLLLATVLFLFVESIGAAWFGLRRKSVRSD